ncbi:G8 domain-containing protein [Francisellaceae bacterium]|nr:G8 domain-containing protein [Francisellaceae bacterium]
MFKFKTSTGLFLFALAASTSSSFSNSLCEQQDIKSLKEHIASNCTSSDQTCNIDTPVAIYSKDAAQLPTPLPPIEIKENGALCVTNDTLKDPIELSAQSFFINNGLMQFGTASSPLKNKITIKMTGKKSAAPAPKPLCKDTDSGIIECSTIAEDSANTPNGRDITVMGSGKLKLYGAKGLTKNRDTSEFYVDHKPTKNQTTAGDDTYIQLNRDDYFNNIYGNQSWTFLSQPAGPSYYDSEHAWVSSPVSYSSIDVYVDGETKPLTIDPANYANYLMLSKNIDKDPDTTWQPGDWISVSTTSFSSHQTEIVQICKIHQVDNPERFSAKPPPIKLNYTLPDTVSLIQLADGTTTCDNGETLAATPLKHYHFGSLAPTPGIFDASDNGKDFTNSDDQTFQPKVGQSYRMYDGAERNYGIDERAEVALLSRNIKFTSDARPGGDGFDHLQPQFFGGHIAVMNHDGKPNPEVKVELVGVELEKFGQAMVGRYPVHLHRLNKDGGSVADPNQLLLQDVSVHHSFNKCFVVHETKSAKLHNNVCVRTVGQGIYLKTVQMFQEIHLYVI